MNVLLFGQLADAAGTRTLQVEVQRDTDELIRHIQLACPSLSGLVFNIFMEWPVAPAFIAESIAMHSSKKDIGAHSIFLGQVRDDLIDGKKVAAIEYTTYTEMALAQMTVIREEIFSLYRLTCLHIHHSLGLVQAGKISLFVFASSRHRRAAIDACNVVVERIKRELPVWGREIFEDASYTWKQNTNG
jgi:molybdopterin synthase catalytic subunit